MNFFPTAYFRWVRRDLSAPTRVLQQWWTEREFVESLAKPEDCRRKIVHPRIGEWRDVPTEQETT